MLIVVKFAQTGKIFVHNEKCIIPKDRSFFNVGIHVYVCALVADIVVQGHRG